MLELQKRLNESVSMNETFKEQVFELENEVMTLRDSKCSLRQSLDDLLEQCEQLSTACSDVDALKDRVRIVFKVALTCQNRMKSVCIWSIESIHEVWPASAIHSLNLGLSLYI